MEAIYGNVVRPTGFLTFAPVKPARGAMFSARRRLGVHGDAPLGPAVAEDALYGAGHTVSTLPAGVDHGAVPAVEAGRQQNPETR